VQAEWTRDGVSSSEEDNVTATESFKVRCTNPLGGYCVLPAQVRVQAEAMEGARREEERVKARLEEAARLHDQAEKIRRWASTRGTTSRAAGVETLSSRSPPSPRILTRPLPPPSPSPLVQVPAGPN
jgi:hypothetical protein